MTDLSNQAQVRIIADQVATAAIELWTRNNPPPPPKQEIPAPLKWAAGIASAVITGCVVAMAIWMAATLSQLQQTTTRIDERQRITGDSTAERLKTIEERLTRLEAQGQRQ